jgi:DNA polymerase-1
LFLAIATNLGASYTISMKKNPKKLVLIDGNAIIHRSYHALPPLTTKKGELVNAVYGFTTTLLNVISKFQPDYIIATFDLAGPTFRHVEYKEYKATRVKADQALYDQIPRVKELVRAFNIPIYEAEGFEADDAIGTIIKQSEKNKDEIENIIVTGDLDTLQLVSPKTKVYTMRRGLTDSVIYDEKAVDERYGLKPSQMIDYKGLRGDASDNIPGVKGIGEKTAIELLKKYETLEGVYKNINDLKGAVKEKLERDKMIAIQSKHLATINTNAPVELKLEDAATHDFDRQRIVNIFQELGFYSLVKRIPSDRFESTNEIESTNATNKLTKEFVCNIKDGKDLDEFVEKINEHKEIAISLYVVGEKLSGREIKGIAINFKASPPRLAETARRREAGGANFVPYSESNFQKLKPVLENQDIKKSGYDLKTDMEVLKMHGIELGGASFDVMLGAYVIDPGSKIEFSKLVLKELGEEIVTEKKKGQLGLEIESIEEVARKNCQLADYIGKLQKIYEEKINEITSSQSENNNVRTVFDNLEMPLIPVLANMETNGIKLNTIIFEGISEKINKRIKNLEESIYKLAGKEFNINSSRFENSCV